MGIFTKDIKTMEDLLVHGLQDIYYAEQQIIKSLPKMIEKATNRDLATGLKAHLEETTKRRAPARCTYASICKGCLQNARNGGCHGLSAFCLVSFQ